MPFYPNYKRIKFSDACLVCLWVSLKLMICRPAAFVYRPRSSRKTWTAVHERLLRAPWLLLMHCSRGPFPGTTPDVMKRP